MDVSCCLLVVFISQGCLNSVHAELQVKDVISSLNGLIESVLQERQPVMLPAAGWSRERDLGEDSVRGKKEID